MDNLLNVSSAAIDFKKGVCAICKKKPVERWCDYIISYSHNLITFRDYKSWAEANTRGAQYETCDLPLCVDCAKKQDGDAHLCPHHHNLQIQAKLPDKYQQGRQAREKYKISMED